MKIGYKCDFCDEFFDKNKDDSLLNIAKHELECLYNPQRKSCFTCAHALCDPFEDNDYIGLNGCDKTGFEGWRELSEDEKDYLVENGDEDFDFPPLPISNCPHYEEDKRTMTHI